MVHIERDLVELDSEELHLLNVKGIERLLLQMRKLKD